MHQYSLHATTCSYMHIHPPSLTCRRQYVHTCHYNTSYANMHLYGCDYKWLHGTTCTYVHVPKCMQQHASIFTYIIYIILIAIKSAYMRLQLPIIANMHLQVTTCFYMKLHASTCAYMRKIHAFTSTYLQLHALIYMLIITPTCNYMCKKLQILHILEK